MNLCKYVIVGEESISILRLSQIVKKAFGGDNVARILELDHLEPFLAANQQHPIVVCFDLFSFDLTAATDTIGRIRDSTYPKVVFNLYLDQDEYRARNRELPERWQSRFLHYFKTFKEGDDVDFEPIVRASMRPATNEALHNMAYEPIRLTPAFDRGVVESDASRADTSHSPMAFVSYSRSDWDGFVSALVSDLSNEQEKVWLDQDYIVGGDDWLDAIGAALEVCDTLLLVLSPDALNSRYVKMEYRHFFRHEKPIIPMLYRQVEKMPVELASLHYLDFTQGDRQNSLSKLLRILWRHRGPESG